MVPARNTGLEASPPVSRSRNSACSRPMLARAESSTSSSGGAPSVPQDGRGRSRLDLRRSCTNTAPRRSRHSPPLRNSSTPTPRAMGDSRGPRLTRGSPPLPSARGSPLGPGGSAATRRLRTSSASRSLSSARSSNSALSAGGALPFRDQDQAPAIRRVLAAVGPSPHAFHLEAVAVQQGGELGAGVGAKVELLGDASLGSGLDQHLSRDDPRRLEIERHLLHQQRSVLA